MTALPQIFAPQSSAPSAGVRAPARETASAETNAPVNAREGDARQKNSNTESSGTHSKDRRFDDAMSEHAQKPTEAKSPAEKDAAPAASKMSGAPTVKQKTASEELSSRDSGSDAVSELAFSDLVASATPSKTAEAETSKETKAPIVTTGFTESAQTAEPEAARPADAIAIDEPLPKERVTIEPVSVETIETAQSGNDIAKTAAETQTNTDVKTATPEVAAEDGVKVQASAEWAEPTPAAETGAPTNGSDTETLLKTADAESADPRLALNTPAEATGTSAALTAGETSEKTASPAANSNAAEMSNATQALAETSARPESKMGSQKDAGADLQTRNRPEAPNQIAAQARRDLPAEGNPRMTRAELDTIRSERATLKASSGAEGFADFERILPMGSKALNLSSLGDTVSVPGLNNALANPVAQASNPVPGALSGPLAGLSERLAASLMQTAQMNPTVTLDKMPQAVVAVALSQRSATIQIDPPELGRIQLEYQFDSQGRTTVTLTPESDATRTALVERMSTITAALEQGSASGVDVKLGNAQDFGSAFSQASNGEAGGDSGSVSGTETASEMNDDTQNISSTMGHHIAADGTARLHIRV